ncbi:prostatic spermine-binding protein-like [Camellia sinensis]|uniref:prostatic spermine-binding protein-like n=1 Tax=Camellia sinensis TaxID=4442 RepID=UPI0010364B1C|nr:prostatic spermine-binding protein-like [Camellia sinensis]
MAAVLRNSGGGGGEWGLQHTTDTESTEGNKADEKRTDSNDSQDLDYIVSEEYSDTETSEDSAKENDDQSWMYEDLGGPNDDIFYETSHRKTKGPPPPKVNIPDDVGWYSDVDDDDDDDDDELISLKGSSDEGDDAGYPEYKEGMMKDPKLVVGMKFPSPQVF